MVRVLIAEDMYLLRRALVNLLELEADIEVVAELDNGDDILAHVLELRPDVAVLDIDLPGEDGLTAARRLRAEAPECRSLILTALAHPGNLRRALDAQVSGFLAKDCDPDMLSNVIRSVAQGRRIIDPQLALAALDGAPHVLTERELEVLRHTADGEEVSQIASRLFLAPGTVRNYLTAVVMKLGARNRIDAVRIAQETGLL